MPSASRASSSSYLIASSLLLLLLLLAGSTLPRRTAADPSAAPVGGTVDDGVRGNTRGGRRTRRKKRKKKKRNDDKNSDDENDESEYEGANEDAGAEYLESKSSNVFLHENVDDDDDDDAMIDLDQFRVGDMTLREAIYDILRKRYINLKKKMRERDELSTDGDGRGGRGLQSESSIGSKFSEDFVDGIIVSAFHPLNVDPVTGEVAILCAGVQREVSQDVFDHKEGPIPLQLVNCFNETNDGFDDNVFWGLNQTTQTVHLNNLNTETYPFEDRKKTQYNYWMDVAQIASGEPLVVDSQNIYDYYPIVPRQWVFNPGPEMDRTWRPDQSPFNRNQYCATTEMPSNTSGPNVFIDTGVILKECARTGKVRRRQVWIYCFNKISCESEIEIEKSEQPDLKIEVQCEQLDLAPTTLSCNGNELQGEILIDTRGNDEDFAKLVPSVFRGKLGNCANEDNEISFQLDRTRSYYTSWGANKNYLYLELESSCGSNDADTQMRVYQQTSSGSYTPFDDFTCKFSGSTDCSADSRDIKFEDEHKQDETLDT